MYILSTVSPIDINNIDYDTKKNNSLDYVTINYGKLYIPALKDEENKIHVLHEYMPVKGAF
eukprot:Pgem_evm1s9056